MNTPQAIAFDEFGRPFIILKEQEKRKRLTGLDAQKVWFVQYIHKHLEMIMLYIPILLIV